MRGRCDTCEYLVPVGQPELGLTGFCAGPDNALCGLPLAGEGCSAWKERTPMNELREAYHDLQYGKYEPDGSPQVGFLYCDAHEVKWQRSRFNPTCSICDSERIPDKCECDWLNGDDCMGAPRGGGPMGHCRYCRKRKDDIRNLKHRMEDRIARANELASPCEAGMVEVDANELMALLELIDNE